MAVDISLGKRSYSIIWNIGKLQSCVSNYFYLENAKWCFMLEIDVNPHQKEEDWKMYLKKVEPKEGDHVFLILVYAEDKLKRLQCLNFTRLTIYRPGMEQILWRRKSNVLFKYPNLKLDDNMSFVITIFFDHYYSTDIKNFSDNKLIQTPSYMEIQPCLENLSHDFSKLMENGAEPDLKVRCGENILNVHKTVLTARSQVFAAMLQSDMLEKSKSFVEIQDMKYSVIEIFLKYLYTGKLPDINADTATGLYEAADKYAVDSLKSRCAMFLKEHLTVENACNVLVLADAHCDNDLKDYVTTYMIQKDILMYMKDGRTFCARYPKLAVDVLYQAYKIMKDTVNN